MKLQNEPNGQRTRLAPESQSCSSAIPRKRQNEPNATPQTPSRRRILQNEPKPLRPTVIAPKVPTSEAAMPRKSKNEPYARFQPPSRRRILQNEPKCYQKRAQLPDAHHRYLQTVQLSSINKSPDAPRTPASKKLQNEPSDESAPRMPATKQDFINPHGHRSTSEPPQNAAEQKLQNEPTSATSAPPKSLKCFSISAKLIRSGSIARLTLATANSRVDPKTYSLATCASWPNCTKENSCLTRE